MRKVTLLLAVLLAASFSTMADAAKKKAAKAAPAPSAMDNTSKLFGDMFNAGNPAPAKQATKGKAKKAKAKKPKAKKKG
jgi:hypothetical protein